MHTSTTVGKREFIQHTSRYLQCVSEKNQELIITHRNQPDLKITKIKMKSFRDLSGITEVIVHGDINDSVFSGYDEW